VGKRIFAPPIVSIDSPKAFCCFSAFITLESWPHVHRVKKKKSVEIQQRGTCSDPSRKLPGKYILVGCCIHGKGPLNTGTDIFHTYGLSVQHSKNESQKIEAFVSVVRYAIHEQMFCL
jgi:hypothetical protein